VVVSGVVVSGVVVLKRGCRFSWKHHAATTKVLDVS